MLVIAGQQRTETKIEEMWNWFEILALLEDVARFLDLDFKAKFGLHTNQVHARKFSESENRRKKIFLVVPRGAICFTVTIFLIFLITYIVCECDAPECG